MISMIRSAPAIPPVAGMDQAAARPERPTSLRYLLGGLADSPHDAEPLWIHLPLAEAERLSPSLQMPRYCETLRCQSQPRTATTFHVLISVMGEADCVWVACADCTRLMLE